MKPFELTGTALDWAVAKCEGVDDYIVSESFMTRWSDDEFEDGVDYHYSTDWAQGGPIIERERITLSCWSIHSTPWKASIEGDTDAGVDLYVEHGTTPLIAAMRCYVASKLGDDIEIPEELK